MAHQRKQAQARGALRDETLKKIRRLQEKLRHMPQGGGYRRVASTLERYKTKLKLLTHKGRRRRDEQEDYIEQMIAAGQGKQPKPWAPPQPITKVGSGVPYVVPEIGYGAAAPEVPPRHLRCRARLPGRHPRCRPRLPGRHLGSRRTIPHHRNHIRDAASYSPV